MVLMQIFDNTLILNSQGWPSGKTALHIAVENKKYDNVKHLLVDKADANIKDSSGKTVLDYVKENDDTVLQEIFAQHHKVTNSVPGIRP